MYEASRVKIVADSVSPSGCRITTFECEYPRYIHAEVMTHRAISRNGRSSRAEPLARVLARAKEDPVQPLVYMYDNTKMRSGEVMPFCGHVDVNEPDNKYVPRHLLDDGDLAHLAWHESRRNAIKSFEWMSEAGLHRQYATRILEPYLRIKMILTATDWANFFGLRLSPGVMPEFQQLVVRMGRLFLASVPTPLRPGEWHLPYITNEEKSAYNNTGSLIKASSARCARISYDSLDGKQKSIEEDVELYDTKLNVRPLHATPMEHPSQCLDDARRVRNFVGWGPWRACMDRDTITPDEFDLSARIEQYEGVDYIL